jgi:hypothetical protein
MQGDFMTFLRNAVLAVILLAGSSGAASALAFKDIAGKWCGETSNYTFNRDTLVVVFHNGSPTKRFTVAGYEYLDGIVKMHWLKDDKALFTDFSEFSANGRTMAQVKSDVGSRRPFHRC